MSDTFHCDFCWDTSQGGRFITSREAWFTGAGWKPVRTVESYTLCAGCYRRSTRLTDMALGPNALRPAGAPLAAHQRTLDFSRCDQCTTFLSNDSYVLELLPAERALGRKDHHHHVGQMRRVRMCAGCFAWCRSVVYDTTGAQGGALRSPRPDIEGWARTHLSNSYSAFLQTEDDASLSMVLGLAGRQNAKLRPWETREAAADGDRPVFIGAGSGLATRFTSSIPADARRRVVVVSRFDTIADMAGALRAGAGDFLTSPLAPEHVIGAFERVLGLPAGEPPSSHPAGLRSLRQSVIHAGGPAQVFNVASPSVAEIATTVWILRRFLRGTDSIGHGRGEMTQAYVHCPETHADDVARRANFILVDHGQISYAGTAAHSEQAAGGLPAFYGVPPADHLRQSA